MDAFKYKRGYTTGAGECVSLAAMYMAAGFVLCGIPLEDMYMILTPLHSQNYLDINDGVITNNRRILTKAMWFNGTEITAKAQRAIQNEQVTIVSHNTGYVHCMYDDATISPKAYEKFVRSLGNFLETDIDLTIFANFLRSKPEHMPFFAFCRHHHGQSKYIPAPTFFRYEHSSKHRIATDTIDKLFAEVADDDLSCCKGGKKIICVSDFLKLIRKLNINITDRQDSDRLTEFLQEYMPNVPKFIDDLCEFVKIVPTLPGADKKYHDEKAIEISTEMSREEIIEYLESIRDDSKTVDLAFYAYRDMTKCDWEPFLRASLERCPVCVEMADGYKTTQELYSWLSKLEKASIYDACRLAYPDEVVNFNRADGIEKAITMATILNARGIVSDIQIDINAYNVVLIYEGAEYEFESNKTLKHQIIIRPGEYVKPLITREE